MSLLVEGVTVMRFRGWFVALLAVGMSWLSQATPSAYGQFSDLLARVPPNANSLVLIDVDAFYRSPMAVRKHWKDNFATRSSEQPIILPPEARRFVLASHLDPLNNLRSDWEAAVIDLGEPLSLSLLARAEGGYIDSLGGTPVVWTPSRSYLIQLDKQLMGMVYPDDRQAAARWIDRMKTGRLTPLSSYLQEASQRLRAEGQIVLALDLTNVMQPHRVDKALKETKILEGRKVNRRAVAEAISSLRGLTVSIRFQSEARATMRVDFAENIRIVEPFAKELVLAAMDRVGATVHDPSKWSTTVEENAIIFQGMLSEAGLTRLSGLLELPTSKFSTLAHVPQEQADAGKAKLEATKRYFNSLVKLIDSLRQESRTSNLWYEKTARKIDGMPILNVDEELLAWGSTLSKGLRQMAEGLRGVGRQLGVAQVSSYGNYYDVGAYGGNGYYRSGIAQESQNREVAGAQVGTVRTTGMQQIENGMADMRRKMTDKYHVEF
ncbi:MAG TPA: hypothetical protein VHX68_09205 [Planctomycetaceae bacterium]|jgi:hypothetical protein|nr:hypothetical protein [Planctomycetaceae bacterium]